MNQKKILEIKKYLSKNGFIVIKDVLKTKKIDNLLKSLSLLFLKKFNFKENYKNKNGLWEIKKYNSELLKFRKNFPEEFSKIYSSIKNIPDLIDILNDKKIIELCSSILDVEKNFLWNGEFTLRLDPPKDKRNTLGWHQEASYYKERTIDGKNGLVISLALSNQINKRNGGLQVCVGSNHNKLLKSKAYKIKSKKFSSKHKSRTHGVDNKLVKKYISKNLNFSRGDIVIMDLKTFHRSGYNASNFFRLTAISRVFDTTSKSYP